MCTHPVPLFPIITVSPFTKWGIYFTTCNLPSVGNQKYIIVDIEYFTKWAKAMPTFKNDSETAALFLFNQVISQFGIPREIFTNHGSDFQNQLMPELDLKLGFWLESIFPIKCGISSLKLVVELLPKMSSLKECLIHLEHLDEQHRDAAIINEAHKKRIKTQYDKVVCPRVFSKGDLVLVYDQEKDALGIGKFKSIWYGPFIV
eukprot:PITA_26596